MCKKILHIVLFSLLSAACIHCGRENIKPISVERNFSGALWIVRDTIATPENVDQLVNIITHSEIKHIFVQVRGRGDAYYRSSLEPHAASVPIGFDPLQYLIAKTRNTDIRIYAWINMNYLLDRKNYPPDPGHILAKHPEWITCDYTGRPMNEYSQKELADNLLEGLFVDPAIPEVKDYIISVIEDILAKYPVDGIHMDYIRYPFSGRDPASGKLLSDFGYNPVARKIFKTRYGIDPITISRTTNSPEKKLFDDFRKDQITDLVTRVNHAVKRKDNDLTVSAAVMPSKIGQQVYFQDWSDWLQKDLIDLACVMSYTDDLSEYQKYIDFASNTKCSRRILMGVRIKDDTQIKNAFEEIQMSYEKDMRGYIIFSFRQNKDIISDLNELVKYDRFVFKY